MASSVALQQADGAELCAERLQLDRSHVDSSASDDNLLSIEAVYRIRRPSLVRFLVRFGLDSVEADDITQEAFLRALDSANSGQASNNLFNWLIVCAKNLALNRRRHEKYEMLAPVELWKRWESTVVSPDDSPEEYLLQKERHRRLIDAVATLSAIEQQYILLRFQDVSFQDMATALRIPVHSAVYYAGTGIQKLQRKLKPRSR